MSPHYLATLQRAHRLALHQWSAPDEMGAIYPRDYWRPADRPMRVWLFRRTF